MSSQSKAKDYIFYVHIAVILFFMFGFGRIFAPISTLTPLGMQLLGVFIGVLYGWTFCGILWPSIMGWVAICSTGMLDAATYIKSSFGNDTIVFIIFASIFTGVLKESGLTDFIANWILSRKFCQGNAWNYSAAVLMASFFTANINMLAAVLVFWAIIYSTAEKAGMKKGNTWVTWMIFGVGCATQFGGLVFPFHMVPLVVLGVASGVTGQEINFLQYMIFAWPTAIAAMLLYIAMGKYFFRFDVSELEGMDFDVSDKSKLQLNARQKIGAVYLLLFLVLLLIPNMLPEGNIIRAILKQQGNVGLTFILLASMCWIKVDGKPFVSIQKCAAGGIQWDIVMIFAFVLPFATLFTHDATGVKPAVIGMLGPILAGKGELMFIVLILIMAGVLTNFANNMVVGSITVALMNMVAGSLQIDIMAVSCAIILIISFAFATPSASTASAMCFANEWCDKKTAFKVGILYSVIGIIIFIPIAYVLIGLIF